MERTETPLRTKLYLQLRDAILREWQLYGYSIANSLFLWTLGVIAVSDFGLPFLVIVRGTALPFDSSIAILGAPYDNFLLAGSLAIVGVIFLTTLRRSESTNQKKKKRAGLLIAASAFVLVALQLLTPTPFLLPLLLAVDLVMSAYAFKNAGTLFLATPPRTLGIILIPLLVPFVAIETGAALRWVSNGFDGAEPFSDNSWALSALEIKLTSVLNPILPRLSILLLAGWLLTLFVSSRSRGAKPSVATPASPGPIPDGVEASSRLLATPTTMLVAVSLVSVVFVCLYSYLPAINPTSSLVGVDLTPEGQSYYMGLSNALSLPPSAALASLIHSDRPLYLLFQYAVGLAAGSPDLAIRLIPSILGVLLVLSTFFFVKTGTRDLLLAATSGLFATFSFIVTAGIDGGFYADWLALIETFVFFALVLRVQERRTVKRAIPATVLGAMVLLTHPWTGVAVMVILSSYMALTAVFSGRERRWRDAMVLVFLAVAVVAGGLAFDYLRPSILPGVQRTALRILSDFNLGNVLIAPQRLEPAFTDFLGGVLLNSAILLLGIVGIMASSSHRRQFSLLIFAWTSVVMLGVLTLNESFTTLLPRLLYSLPLPVLSAMGFLSLTRYTAGFVSGPTGEQRRLGRLLTVLVFAFIYALLLAYGLRIVDIVPNA